MDCLLEGPQDSTEPGDRKLFLFDYARTHPRYHAAGLASAEIVLYKGGIRGLHDEGFLSNALREGRSDHLLEVKDIIERGDEREIRDIFDRHTTYYSFTPFLSATFNPAMAQVFASTYPLRKIDTTIYELRVKAERCVVDAYDTGGCGNSREVLVLGAIFPDEIRRVKIINDDRHSELIYETRSGTAVIRPKPEKDSSNTDIKDRENWMRLDMGRLKGPRRIVSAEASKSIAVRKVA